MTKTKAEKLEEKLKKDFADTFGQRITRGAMIVRYTGDTGYERTIICIPYAISRETYKSHGEIAGQGLHILEAGQYINNSPLLTSQDREDFEKRKIIIRLSQIQSYQRIEIPDLFI